MVESLYPMLPMDPQAEPSRSPNSSRMSIAVPFPANNPVTGKAPSPVRTEPAVQSADMSSYKIVLGYDFGTTFSGASYAYCQNEEVLDIERWYVHILVFSFCQPEGGC
jgi:hypothetical protein